MTKGDFHGAKAPKAVGAFGVHSDLVVEALDGATGEFPRGQKLGEVEGLVVSARPKTV